MGATIALKFHGAPIRLLLKTFPQKELSTTLIGKSSLSLCASLGFVKSLTSKARCSCTLQPLMSCLGFVGQHHHSESRTEWSGKNWTHHTQPGPFQSLWDTPEFQILTMSTSMAVSPGFSMPRLRRPVAFRGMLHSCIRFRRHT